MNQPPATLDVRPTAIPDDLKAIPQWVCWEWTYRDPKWTKPPINPRTGWRASSTDSATWTGFGQAVRYARQNRLPGIGMVLTHEAGVVAVDLDKCCHDGLIDTWALDIICRFASYTELSPSGTGIRILCWAVLPVKGRRKGATEIYQAERYITITGHRLDEMPDTMAPAQDATDWLMGDLGTAVAASFTDWTPQPIQAGDLRSRAACARIRRDTLALLDNTGAAHYPSASEADSAIACALIGAGFTADEALSLILDSVRGVDAGRRKGDHAGNYWRRTISHAEAFASPASVYGIPVHVGNGARSIRELTIGSRYSQIDRNAPKSDLCEFANNANLGDV